MNIALLNALQDMPDSYLWPESLARELNLTPNRLRRDLDELESFGFGIELLPHRGIRYVRAAEKLCVDQIEWQLDTRLIGRRISVWRRTTSTNDVAARAATSRSNDGLVIVAEEQTAGRGRRHRPWFAPPHSAILMSVLLFPPAPLRNVLLLTSLAAVAVTELVAESFSLPAKIKWPNDVRVEGKKICGILVEDIVRKQRALNGRPVNRPPVLNRASVIGIGINANIPAERFPSNLDSPASSLLELSGRSVDRSRLVRQLIQRLDQLYQLALQGKTRRIWKVWRENADLIGQSVRVHGAGVEWFGRLLEIKPPDSISLRTDSGKLLTIAANEVISVSQSE